MKKVILMVIGVGLLTLGAVGIFIPILPTTPFVLAAAACFSVGSEKLHKKLLASRIFGPYIRHYRDKTGVPLRLKIWTLLFLWTMLIVSAALINRLAAYLALAAVGIAVSAHIALIRVKRPRIKKPIAPPSYMSDQDEILDSDTKKSPD